MEELGRVALRVSRSTPLILDCSPTLARQVLQAE